jgi:hypothetical protein
LQITIFGSGYVGLVTGACLADAGNDVVCVDIDAGKIERLNAGEVPIHEPGLDELISRNRDKGRLSFTTDAKAAVAHGGALTLEITESVLLKEPEAARRNIEMLRLAGVRFAIDDFGTGYSSLSQLRAIAADELKIDQSFVRDLCGGAEHTAVIRAIIELAHGLGLRTVAEGVETEEQWQVLAALGCDCSQGYLTGRPQLAEELTPWLAAVVADTDPEPAARTASLRVLELRRRD